MRFKTSEDTSKKFKEIIEAMSQNGSDLKLSIASLAQICFALSFRKYKNTTELGNYGHDGKEILDMHFLGKEENFYRAIVETVYGKNLTDDEFFSNTGIVKLHVDKGAEMLYSMFEEVNKDPEALKDRLIDLVC